MKIEFEARVFKGKDDEFMGWRIFEMPKALHTYAIGVDTSEGKGRDANCAQVMDVSTGRLVANFWSTHIDIDNYAAEVYKAGYFYNRAKIIIECNNQSGGALITNLSGIYANSLKYSYLYKRYEYDEYTKKKTKMVGWRTTGSNKGILLSNFNSAVRDGDCKITDKYTIAEMSTFVCDEKTGKLGAKGSARDDRIMAAALAWEQVLISRLSLKDNDRFLTESNAEYDLDTGFRIS